MSLLKRRTAAPERADPDKHAGAGTAAEGQAHGQSQGQAGSTKAGKGRPTPKRSEARAARAKGVAAATPVDRKQAREERRRQTREYRAAMASGDVNKLPPRERAPERILARDFVDSRINVGPFFLLVAALYFVGGIVPNDYVQLSATYLMLLGILAVVIDSIVLSRQVSRRIAQKYPDSRVKVRAYAAQRALLPRRWRMPKPRVDRHGERI